MSKQVITFRPTNQRTISLKHSFVLPKILLFSLPSLSVKYMLSITNIIWQLKNPKQFVFSFAICFHLFYFTLMQIVFLSWHFFNVQMHNDFGVRMWMNVIIGGLCHDDESWHFERREFAFNVVFLSNSIWYVLIGNYIVRYL